MSKRMKRSLSILFAVAMLVGAGLTLVALQSPVKAGGGGGPHQYHVVLAEDCGEPPCGPDPCDQCRPQVSDSVHLGGPVCILSGCPGGQCTYDCPFTP